MKRIQDIRAFTHFILKYIQSHRIWKYGLGIAILSGICMLTFHLYKKITRTPIWHYTIELENSENIRIESVKIALTFPYLWQKIVEKSQDNASEEKNIPSKKYLSIRFTYGIRGNAIMESRPHKYYISDKWILDSIYGYTKRTITFESNLGKMLTDKSQLTNDKQYGYSIWHYNETKNRNATSSQNMSQFTNSEYTFYGAILNQYKDFFYMSSDMRLIYPPNIWVPYNMSKICLQLKFIGKSIEKAEKLIDIDFQTPVELANTYPQPEDNSFAKIKYHKSTSWEEINQNGINTIASFISYIPLQESRVYILTTIITLCISGIITLIIRLVYFHIKSIYDL